VKAGAATVVLGCLAPLLCPEGSTEAAPDGFAFAAATWASRLVAVAVPGAPLGDEVVGLTDPLTDAFTTVGVAGVPVWGFDGVGGRGSVLTPPALVGDVAMSLVLLGMIHQHPL
jgi:hypothetical protein